MGLASLPKMNQEDLPPLELYPMEHAERDELYASLRKFLKKVLDKHPGLPEHTLNVLWVVAVGKINKHIETILEVAMGNSYEGPY